MKLRARRRKVSLDRHRTRAVGPTFTLYIHPDMEFDLRKLTGTKLGRQEMARRAGIERASGYRGPQVAPGELVMIEGIRVVSDKHHYSPIDWASIRHP